MRLGDSNGPSRTRRTKSFLYFGFTTLLDLVGSGDRIARWNALELRPTAYFCAAAVTVNHQVRHVRFPGFSYAQSSAAFAAALASTAQETPEAVIGRIADDGAICVKTVYDSFVRIAPSVEELEALVAAAHARDSLVFIHANRRESQALAVAAGVDVMAHGMWRNQNEAPGLDEEARGILAAVVSNRMGYQRRRRSSSANPIKSPRDTSSGPAGRRLRACSSDQECLIFGFCPSGRGFASALLSDGTSRSPPLRLASPSSPPDLGQRTRTSKLSNMLGTPAAADAEERAHSRLENERAVFHSSHRPLTTGQSISARGPRRYRLRLLLRGGTMGEILKRPLGITILSVAFLAAGCTGIVVGWGAWPQVSSISPLLALFVLAWSCGAVLTAVLAWRGSRFAGAAFVATMGFLLFPARYIVPGGQLFLPACVVVVLVGGLGYLYLSRARAIPA